MPPILRLPGRRPAPGLLVTTLLVAGLAACGGAGTAPTSPAVAPTAAPPVTLPPTTAPASPAPATAAPPTPVAGGQGEVAGTITARNIAFQPTDATVAADTPFVLVLENADSGVPHGLQVQGPDGSALATSEIITGPAQVQLAVPPLGAGTYTWMCPVHPTMTGTLTVE